jgi:hypothetical protein
MTAVITSAIAASIAAPSPIEAAVIPWAVVPVKSVIPISGVTVVIGTGGSVVVWPVTIIVGGHGYNRAPGKEHNGKEHEE